MHLLEKGRVVKSFRKVKEDGVYLARLVEADGKVADSVNELSITVTAPAKTVLEVRGNRFGVKKVDYGTIHNMFSKFTNDASNLICPPPVITGLISNEMTINLNVKLNFFLILTKNYSLALSLMQ